MSTTNATNKLFQLQPYLRETSATILERTEDSLILDRSIFAPEAGGQPCDLGIISLGHSGEFLEVLHVSEKNGILYHKVQNLPQAFQSGKEVLLQLNWERRFDHMQNHCAEHILSGILFTRHGIANKGFHLGTDFSTLDADIKNAPAELITELEDLANEVVFSRVPVEIEMIESKEDAEKRPLRKALKVDEDISVVTIPGVDCVACCCPHPTTTAEVGLIKIIRAENYKGMTRIYFLAGKRALLDYRKKHDVISVLNQKYSSDEDSLIENIKIHDKKVDQLRRDLHTMQEIFAGQEADRLIARAVGQGSAENEGLTTAPVSGKPGLGASGEAFPGAIIETYERESLDGLKRIAKKLMERTDAPVILASDSQLCVLLTHSGKSTLHMGQIVKDFACGFGGKGGGSNTQAQALFKDKEVMDNFLKIAAAHTKHE